MPQNYYDPRRYTYTPRTPSPAVTPPPPVETPKPGGVVEPGPGTTPQNWMDYLNQDFDATKSIWGEAGRDSYQRNRASEFFKTRGGHELYNWFKQIYDRNPMAGRAFWEQMVGSGRGQNDLQAATIHKMFGGDMNAYNTWRNELHHGGRENQLGNFNLVTGKWDNGGITDGWGWDSVGVGQWNPYYAQTGLQSLPGNAADGTPNYMQGADSWRTYGAGQHFDPTVGAAYPGPGLQAQFAAGEVPGYDRTGRRIAPNISVPKVDVPGTRGPGTNAPAVPVSPHAGGPSTTNPYATSSGGTYRYR